MNLQSKSPVPPAKMSIEAFFDWTETQERRYELVEGVACMMPWVKRSHSLIAGNIIAALRAQIDRRTYALHQGDFAAPTGPDSVRFADVLVERRGASVDERTTDTAIVLVEILSASTRHIDFGAKAREYMRLPSLDSYLIVEQQHRHAWLWTRDRNGSWPDEAIQLSEPDAEFRIAAIGCTLRFKDIYEDVL
jgi:Uma2 family endonuclease